MENNLGLHDIFLPQGCRCCRIT